VVVRFERAAEQARALALRLGKGELTCIVDGGDVRLPRERWGGFFQALAHVIRNAIDHGLYSEAERESNKKLATGRLTFRASAVAGNYVIEVEDNGRGVDWSVLRERAVANGLPASTHAELVRAMFSDGITTRDAATEHSGRGFGMSAVWQAVGERSGRIDVRSEPGKGANFVFTFPVLGNDLAPVDSRYPGARPSLAPALMNKQ
jgi:two-component system chemotaxis sensor kinase CheA